nr:hypothetical protein [Amylibacter marinus]
MVQKFKNQFLMNEAGAVTVDWVVLTAGVVVLTGLVMDSFVIPAQSLQDKVSSAINNPISSN